MFFGRKSELQFLEDKYNSPKAQLIVLYGRRRIGKTKALIEFCKGKPHVFYSCTEVTDASQLARFSKVMFKEDIPAKNYTPGFADWETALRSVLDLPYGDRKKLLVVDEFPYMCKGNKSIPSILQYLWDMKLKDCNVMIILCGSAVTYIEQKLLSAKSPLYGRATGIYKMKEMGFYDAVQFFPEYSSKDKVLAYSIFGGIPYYLRQIDQGLTLAENIREKILTHGSLLYNEAEFLLYRELRDPTAYNVILEAAAPGNTRLSDISRKSLVYDTSKVNIYLKKLIELGFVTRDFSVDVNALDGTNANRGFYRLTDNFFRFWYTFCFPNLSQLEAGDADGVYSYLIEPALQKFASLSFEDICRQFVRKLQKQNALPFYYSKMGRWNGKLPAHGINKSSRPNLSETEIDLLAVNMDETAYLDGQCKFLGTPFTCAEYLNFKEKLTPLPKTTAVCFALFSASGFDNRLIHMAAEDKKLLLYDLDQIVRDPRST